MILNHLKMICKYMFHNWMLSTHVFCVSGMQLLTAYTIC